MKTTVMPSLYISTQNTAKLSRRPAIATSRKGHALFAALILWALLISSLPSWAAIITIGNDASGGSIPTTANYTLVSGTSYQTSGTTTKFNSLTLPGGNTLSVTNLLVLSSTGGTTIATNAGSDSLITGGTMTTGTSNIFTVNTNTSNLTINSVITGTTGLTKTSAGTLTLTGANTYTGQTSVNSGVLELHNLGLAVQGDVTVFSGGTLRILGNGQLPTTSNLLMTGGVLDITTHSGTYASVTMGASGQIIGSGTVCSLADFSLQGGTVSAVLGGAVGAWTFSGTTVLTNSNTYTGTTTTSSGVLQLNSASGNALPGNATITGGTVQLLGNNQIATSGRLNVNGGVLDLQGNSNTVAGVQLTSGTINGSGGALTSTTAFDMQSGNVGAILSGTVGMTKSTPDIVTLTGVNTYTGATSINKGMVIVQGAITSSTMTTVITGGALSGTGSVGALTVGNGGTLIPGGNSPGKLKVGNTTLQNGGTLMLDLTKNASGIPGTGYDQLAITGILDLTGVNVGGFILSLYSIAGDATTFDPSQSYTWNSFFTTTTGTINGFAANKFSIDSTGLFAGSLNGGSFEVVQNGNNLDLKYQNVPEPGTWALLVSGAGILFAFRRKNRSNA